MTRLSHSLWLWPLVCAALVLAARSGRATSDRSHATPRRPALLVACWASPEGEAFAVLALRKPYRLWYVRPGKRPVKVATRQASRIETACWRGDGSEIIFVEWQAVANHAKSSLWAYNVRNGKMRLVAERPRVLTELAPDPSGRWLEATQLPAAEDGEVWSEVTVLDLRKRGTERGMWGTARGAYGLRPEWSAGPLALYFPWWVGRVRNQVARVPVGERGPGTPIILRTAHDVEMASPSPDGRYVIYTYTRSRKDSSGKVLLAADTERGKERQLAQGRMEWATWGPSWSPDGCRAAVVVDGDLVTIDVASGARRTVARQADSPIRGTAWTRSGIILFRRRGQVWAVGADGRSERMVLDLARIADAK